MELKDKIKDFRIKNELTQENLAKLLFVSRSSVAKWEQGRSLPSIDILNKMSEMFKVTIDELINEKDIKTMTLKNAVSISKNKSLLRWFILFIILAFIALTIFLIIINDRFNDSSENEIDVEISSYVKITESDNIFTFIDKEKNKVDYTKEFLSKVQVLNRKGNETTYQDLLSGYYLKLIYNNSIVMENLKRIEIIEDYISDYKLYGFFISNNSEVLDKIPVYAPNFDFNDKVPDIQIFDNFSVSQSFKYPYMLYKSGFFASSYDIIKILDSNYIYDDYGTESLTYNIQVKIDANKLSKIKIFAVDNTEEGFHLFKEMSTIGGKITLKGMTFNEQRKDLQNYEMSYSHEIIYNINISYISVLQEIVLYQYDKNNTLISEATFTSYLDYSYKGYKRKEETIYVIVKEVYNNKDKTTIIGIGSNISVVFLNGFGYANNSTITI